MNLIGKLLIKALFGLFICSSMFALDAAQQKEQLVQTQNFVQNDSTTNQLNKHVRTIHGSDTDADLNTNFKLTDNTILDRTYHNENTSFGIDSHYNLNLDFDASTKIFKTDDLKFKLNSIIDQNADSGIESSFISMDWERTRDTKFGYSFSLAHTGKSYSPTLEYIMRKGVLVLDKKLTYGWYTNKGSRIKKHNLNLSNSSVWNYSSSLIENNFLKADWVLETKSENTFKVSLFNEYSNVGGSFTILRDIEIPSGKYTDMGFTLRYELGKPEVLKTNFELTARTLFNSKGYSFSIDSSWNLSKKLSLNTGLNLHHYRFDSNESIRLVLPFVKSSYNLGPKLSLDLFSQYNTETNRVAINSNINMKLKGGHRLDLAYQHNKNVEVANPFLKTPDQNDNILFLKYTYSFAN